MNANGWTSELQVAVLTCKVAILAIIVAIILGTPPFLVAIGQLRGTSNTELVSSPRIVPQAPYRIIVAPPTSPGKPNTQPRRSYSPKPDSASALIKSMRDREAQQ